MTKFPMLHRILLCCIFAILLAALGTAATAEETLLEDQVELFSQGDFPVVSPMPVRTFGLSSFENYMAEQLLAASEKIDIRPMS